MMVMRIIIKANLQMPIWWQQVNTGYGEMNDDDFNNENKSAKVNMVTASEDWVWRDE